MTDKKELYASGEPGLSYDPLEVDEGWEPPYRNKNACLEQVRQAVAPMWHNIDALRKQLDFLENIIEDALTTYYGDDCYYQLKQDYNAYQKEFYGVKEDRPHKDPGKARAAKVHRVPTADEMVAAQPMTAPTRLEIEWRNIQKANEK